VYVCFSNESHVCYEQPEAPPSLVFLMRPSLVDRLSGQAYPAPAAAPLRPHTHTPTPH
jgi:hypothetical protein